jgi:hypothetical protein
MQSIVHYSLLTFSDGDNHKSYIRFFCHLDSDETTQKWRTRTTHITDCTAIYRLMYCYHFHRFVLCCCSLSCAGAWHWFNLDQTCVSVSTSTVIFGNCTDTTPPCCASLFLPVLFKCRTLIPPSNSVCVTDHAVGQGQKKT